MNINKFLGVGNLVKDPELKKVGEVNKVTFSLAISSSRVRSKDKTEEVGFFDCEAWSSAADIIAKLGKKGRKMFIEALLRQERWTDAEGKSRSRYVLRVEEFYFLDSPGPKPTSTSTENVQEPEKTKEFKVAVATPF